MKGLAIAAIQFYQRLSLTMANRSKAYRGATPNLKSSFVAVGVSGFSGYPKGKNLLLNDSDLLDPSFPL